MGGLAVFVSLVASFLFARMTGWSWLVDDSFAPGRPWAFMVTAGMFCGVGLWDDRFPISAGTKFLLQIAACIPCAYGGPTVAAIGFAGIELPLGPFGTAFTIFWLVSCVNVFNLIDGLVGLASTIGLIACSALVAISLDAGRHGTAAMGLITAACIVGFLIHNFPPAKIFLGDAGSMTIGFLVGSLAIAATITPSATLPLSVPLAIISVPVFDTLQERGLGQRQTLLTIGAICLLTSSAAVVAANLQRESFAIAGGCSALALLVASRVFGHYETALLFRHIRVAGPVLASSWRVLRVRWLAIQTCEADKMAHEFLWREVRRRLNERNGAQLCIRFDDGPGDTVFSKGKATADTRPGAVARIHFSYLMPLSDRKQLVSVEPNQLPLNSDIGWISEIAALLDELCRLDQFDPHAQPARGQLSILNMDGNAPLDLSHSESDQKPQVATRRAA
ncbi:MAG: undecaprenyl/decaprenyl-phosphate alpha-N-acetylglucosaminyl 1-phosphate transferase [Planctomycetia bacterium]|nr:undecaprenyl/decaprenyl-phosphate alpha-N-acetylglucosaminyl 1-phosphate transferase [Planctomycetia bacterium]